MHHLQRLFIVVLFLSTTVVVVLSKLPRFLDPTPPSSEDRLRDKRWVSSSPYWIDRQTCRWLTLCGIHHLRSDPATHPSHGRKNETGELGRLDLRRRSHWSQGGQTETLARPNAASWGSARRRKEGDPNHRDANDLKEVPDYVLKYAPLIHLHSEEYFFPSDIADHVEHMVPYANGMPLNLSKPVSLDELHDLDAHPLPIYLTSEEDVEDRPEWLHSEAGMPRPFVGDGEGGGDDGGPDRPRSGDQYRGSGPPRHGTTWWDVDKDHPLHHITEPRKGSGGRRGGRGPRIGPRNQQPLASPSPMYKPDSSGYSDAPAVLVLVDKGSGILDAFWYGLLIFN